MDAMPSYADPPFAVAPDVSVLAADYARLGNVWKVGALHGIKGSTVHGRLRRAGLLQPRAPEFTSVQIERIKQYYAATSAADFDLQVLADELRKSRHNVCRTARRLGLSDQGRVPSAATCAKGRVPKWRDKPHPRGMAGKNHSAETLVVMSAASKKNWSTWKTFGTGPMTPEAREATSKRMHIVAANRPASSNFTRTKGGHREDLGGLYFRSSWEANYARYLNLLVKFKVVQSWEFEPETFWFENIKRGVRSYLLDFRVYYVGEENPTYVEVKGWMDAKSKTKIARFRKYYPQHRLEIVGAKEYYAIQKKWASAIPGWESAKSAARVTVRPCA